MLQLLGLLLVFDDEGVEESGASNLEFGALRVLLDLDTLGILSPGLQEEILDFFDFTRHFDGESSLAICLLKEVFTIRKGKGS